MASPKKFICGNWKMNGNPQSYMAMLEALDAARDERVDIALAPPAPLLSATDSGVLLGGQNCHPNESGAHTGDISAALLHDIGCSFCIVGHSERRADHGETNAYIADCAKAAIAANLTAVVCVGEQLADRDANKHVGVVLQQLAQSVPDGASAANCIVAYEPVWAIGTGRTAEASDIDEMHSAIRTALMERFGDGEQMRILYGGSVKPANALEIFGTANVDGGLVGGASLSPEQFAPIIEAALEAS